MEIRKLNPEDAEASRTLRLEALRNNPAVFVTTLEEAEQSTAEKYRERLSASGSATFGAFIDGRLVGTVTLVRQNHWKMAHRASLLAMYVSPAARGKGTGRRLIQALCDYAAAAGIEQVELCVVSDNEVAKRLYRDCGFEIYGRLDNTMKVAGEYIHEDLMLKHL